MSRAVTQIPSQIQNVRKYFATHVTKSYAWRKKQLEACLRMMQENDEAIQAALVSDLRKPTFEASFAEILTVQKEIKATLNDLASWMEPTPYPTPLALLPGSSYTMKEPYGVVLVIGPFNYPVQLAMLPLVAAVAAGNCVVLKPSELTPASSKLLATLIPKYLDNQAFFVVEGAIEETTALLKEKFDYIFFTGSEFVGKVVLRAAAEHLTPCTLELGGKSPVIVEDDADITIAARRVLWGKCLNAGQTCIAPDYVFVHSKIKKAFVDELVKCKKNFFTENPQSSPDLARIVNERHTQRLAKLIDAHKSDIVHGGKVDVSTRYIEPTIISTTTNGEIMKEEIFGPLMPIIEYSDLSSVVEFINSRPKPLALYLFTSKTAVQERILSQTSSGGVSINDTLMHFANAELPFGGVGNSGYGAYHGKWGFDTFSHTKPVLNKSLYGDAPARYPPYTAFNYKLFRYVSEIYRVNSQSFAKLFKFVLLPIVVAAIAKSVGLTVGFKSNL